MEAHKQLILHDSRSKSRAKSDKELKEILNEISRLVKLPVRDSDPAHTLFSYPAKFQAAVPSFIIETLSSKGDTILDPFGGGGTTATCAKARERAFVHYDLSPFSCLVAKAKTASISAKDASSAIELLKSKIQKKSGPILTEEEEMLLGGEVSLAVNHAWSVLNKVREKNTDLAAIIAVIMAKLVKVCGRRDATARRNKPASEHIKYIATQLEEYCQYLIESQVNMKPFDSESRKVNCASNHDMNLKQNSVDMIVTSPPYPGVDVEYAQIQLQRRDLNRCFRSNFPLRIAQSFFKGKNPSKKQLCNGGEDESSSYYTNALKSLAEMKRVLKRDRMAFVYCGFKTELDQKRYEAVIKEAGFQIIHRAQVILSDDRVASSRSTHHGKETNMMQRDILFVLT